MHCPMCGVDTGFGKGHGDELACINALQGEIRVLRRLLSSALTDLAERWKWSWEEMPQLPGCGGQFSSCRPELGLSPESGPVSPAIRQQ
jgi:hypothetical protein